MTSFALHAIGITAAIAFGVYAPVEVARPPARVAVELRPASAAASARVAPPDVVVEPLDEQRILHEPSSEPPPMQLPEAALPSPATSELPPLVSPAMMLARATLERVRLPVRPPDQVPLPCEQQPMVAVESAARPVARVEARPCVGNEPPRYPERERRLGCEDRVVVTVLLDALGVVENVSLRSASPYEGLNREALRAVRRWRFEPALADGVPVPSETDIEVLFQLHG